MASETIVDLTVEIEDLRETLQQAEKTRISYLKRAEAREDTIVDLRGEIYDGQVSVQSY